MELFNKIKEQKQPQNTKLLSFTWLLKALHPFCPHLTSELWTELNLPLSELTRLPNFSDLLESLEPPAKLRLSVNGKFITVLEVNSSLLGDS